MLRTVCAVSSLVGLAAGQQGSKTEDGPRVLVHNCKADGSCKGEEAAFTIDASWRVQHNATKGGWQSCIIQDGMWQTRLCPDPLTCGKNCAVDGMDLDAYSDVHGITELDNGIRLNYVTATQYGLNIGARLYMLGESYDEYKVFFLKNKEFAFDVNVGTVPCGVNAALYLVNMDKKGGKGTGNNDAGAKYGTGYCDAHCPHGSNFVEGEANMDWSYGVCCPEIDLFEGNSKAQAFTAHTCKKASFKKCTSPTECGDSDKGHHYEGICDKDGCDFNPFRMHQEGFWGDTVDTDKTVTVVTQFITTNGKDDGPLKEIRRKYIQGGKVFENPQSKLPGVGGDSINDKYCGANKKALGATRSKDQDKGDFDQFGRYGGMAKIGEALENGMVVAVSLWDDPGSNMRWLDSTSPHKKPDALGAKRGPCDPETNVKHTRRMHQLAHVKFENIMYGAIGSTEEKLAPKKIRRFEQTDVSMSSTIAEQRRPLVMVLFASGGALSLLAMIAAGFSRVRSSRRLVAEFTRSQAPADCEDTVMPLAPSDDQDGASPL